MSVLDKLLDAVKLNDDYDEDDYLDDDLLDSDDDDFLDDDQEDKPVKKFFQKFSKKADDEEVDDFDDEEPVAAAPKQPVKTVSIPKVSVKQDQAGTKYFIQDHSNAKQQKGITGSKYGSMCNQTYIDGRYS